MVLTRNLVDESYYTEGDRSVQKTLDEVYAQAITINQSFWSEADIDTRFKVGDQGLYDDYYGNLPAFRRKQFYFNRIRRVCNLITGHQRRNRKSTIAVPVEHNDEQTASQISKLLFYSSNQANASEIISEAFEHGSVTTGMSLVNVWLDKTVDPVCGDIRMDHVPYNSFLIDPYFKHKDLSDCNFIWRRKWLSKDAVKNIMPGREDEIDEMRPRGNRDGKFQFMAEAYNYGMQNLLSYDEYWYSDMRPAKMIIDAERGISKEWKGSKENLEMFLQEFPQLIVKDSMIPTVKLAIVVEGMTMYNGPNPLKIDRYPFVPFIGYYEPNIPYFPWRVQGVVRNLRDSQFLYNRRKIIELDILESQVNSGFIYKPESLVNPRDIFMEGQGKGIPIKQEANIGEDIQKIEAPGVPTSMIQLSELLGREIQEISGVNEELLGSADDDKAGILSMLRQGAGLTTLQVLFDQLDFSQKLLGEVQWEIMQENFREGKIQRILGEPPSQQFKEKLFLKYDIRIEEGFDTSTQRQLQFAQLLHLKETGVPIPDKTLIEAATVQNKDELLQDMAQEAQVATQQQQMQMQAQMELMQAQIEKLHAEVIESQGLGIERLSRITENKMLTEERRTQAIENVSDARLNRVKVLKELEEMDLNQLQKLIEIANNLSIDRDREEVIEGVDSQAT